MRENHARGGVRSNGVCAIMPSLCIQTALHLWIGTDEQQSHVGYYIPVSCQRFYKMTVEPRRDITLSPRQSDPIQVGPMRRNKLICQTGVYASVHLRSYSEDASYTCTTCPRVCNTRSLIVDMEQVFLNIVALYQRSLVLAQNPQSPRHDCCFY